MFSKILVANRGEIAVRIIRACKEMGIKTVAIYSEADRDALHALLADESFCVGSPLVTDSYLNRAAILTVAKKCKVEAIHPGYGLLSENADFAQECIDNGIAFIGPSPEVIRRMGDKDEARRTMKEAKVPIIEGSKILEDVKEAKKTAKKLGYPVLLKARSGGGGKGIRLVNNEDELEFNFINAGTEAEEAFGDGALYMEKYLAHAKHVEVQLLADSEGKVVILGDRDCSIQHKNQKLVEECPAPCLPDDIRKSMYEDTIKAAKAVGYVTVGTIEFLFLDGKYYFMEMNTRLQVEHSVTEMISMIDIVKWQIRTAAGCAISFTESDVNRVGHAMEFRICAMGAKDFMPKCGRIDFLHMPGGLGVRFDAALYDGLDITPYYDSMLGKLMVISHTRSGAIRKMRAALSELIIHGVENNSDFFIDVLADEDFQSGNYTTAFVDRLRGSR